MLHSVNSFRFSEVYSSFKCFKEMLPFDKDLFLCVSLSLSFLGGGGVISNILFQKNHNQRSISLLFDVSKPKKKNFTFI
jgi:hypothetical protein